MKLSLTKNLNKLGSIIIIPFEKNNIDKNLIKSLSGLDREIEFNGKNKECVKLYHPSEPREIYLIGLGEVSEKNNIVSTIRSIIFNSKKDWKNDVQIYTEHLSDVLISNTVEGCLLATKKNVNFKLDQEGKLQHEFDTFHVINSKKEVQKILDKAIAITDTQSLMMECIDLPSNIKTPYFIAELAEKSGKTHGFKTKIFKGEEISKNGLAALDAVGRGSENPPAFVIMEYKPKGSNSKNPKVGLVGKGITFDTGGLSLKPSANMGYMKSDMAGSAAVIGTMELVAKLQLPIHVVGVVPLAENSVDALSYRPGDVISSYSGMSIEVIDTDAEGRLVLADGLSYLIKNYNPEHIIDLATLTGNCILALGYHAAALFTKNDELASNLITSGLATYEKLWQLPLWDDYMPEMNSDIADIKNLSTKPVAGAITAAKFLESFTEKHSSWAHIDIAGVAFTDSEYTKMRSATGFGIKLLYHFIEKMCR